MSTARRLRVPLFAWVVVSGALRAVLCGAAAHVESPRVPNMAPRIYISTVVFDCWFGPRIATSCLALCRTGFPRPLASCAQV